MAAGEAVPGGLCAPRKELTYANGQTVGIRLMSDLHVGAQNVDYKLIRREIDEAIKFGYRIGVNGDVFDAIVAKDPRFSPDVLHPRLQGRRDILNAAVAWAVELFGGAEDLIDFVGVGNHEDSVSRYGGIDICQCLVYELQKKVTEPGHVVQLAGYCGFGDFRLRIATKGRSRTSAKSQRLLMFYHHGSGGGAPVTGGMIDFNRRQTWIEGVDVIWHGHKHSRFVRDVTTHSLSTSGNLLARKVLLVQTGAYFDTYELQSQESYRKNGRRSNYAADMACSPQGKGGVLLLAKMCANKGGSMELRAIL